MKKHLSFKKVSLMMVFVIAASFAANAQLYINEFMASNDNAFPGPQGDYPDWIEIYNAGNEAVNLAGYYLSDKLDDPEAMYQIPDTYPDSVTVPAGGFILFYANKNEETSVLNLNFKLKGSGEQIGLWNPDQEFIDSLTYGPQTADISYGRYPDGGDSWFFMEDYTPGAANHNPSAATVTLYINEFMASNDNAFPGPQGDYPDWIEIYNAGDEAVNLAGYYLSDKLDDPEALYQIPDTYPDSVTVPAGGFILFYANKNEETSVLNLNFKLKGSGEQIGLWNPDQEFIDSLTYGPQSPDTSYGRYPDGSETWYFMPEYTPGAPNAGPNGIENHVSNISTVKSYPNPFFENTSIEFALKKSDNVKISVYNISGEEVAVLANKRFDAGKHVIDFDANDLPSGIYLVKIHSSEGNSILKITKNK